MSIIRWAKDTAHVVREIVQLPESGRKELIREWHGLPTQCPTPDDAIAAALQWLKDAQDGSASRDGGVASYYSLSSGWAASYPETTGYIVPTLIECAKEMELTELLERAACMLEWLVSIQFDDGSFPGGTVGAEPRVPVTFNTGQILMGLAAGAAEFGGKYVGAMRAAADWLVRTQDDDGCWRRHPSPFTTPGDKSYETHVAWALLQAEGVLPGKGYREAGMANIRWALTRQQDNGWFNDCCLNDPSQPLTHTIGYVLRGCVEGFAASRDPIILERTIRTANALIGCMSPSGFIPGRLDRSWRGTVPWACLTGTAQIAHCWIILHRITGDPRYLTAASIANRYVRRSIRLDGIAGIRGGVKGSVPIWGGYCPYWFINWGAKFFLDSQRAEIGC